MAFVKSQTLVGMIQTTEGLRPAEMTVVSLEDQKEANHASNSYAGFKIVYGRTEAGEVYEFIKAGNWAKRDLNRMKEMGVIELVCSWCWAPKNFEVLGKLVQVSRSFECGKATVERFNRYARAMM